jgi:steroid 5-alpha reductase family enzyme
MNLDAMAAVGLAISALFLAAWFAARWLNNYGIVDVVWGYAFAPAAIALAGTAHGWSLREWLVAGLVAFWSVRLGSHLLRRVAGHHPVEDARYAALRLEWADGFGVKMFLFFQMQALSVLVLLLPVVLALRNPATAFAPVEIAGVALWFLALAGETIADSQLGAHKRDPARRCNVCERGLWRFSRHPNYFFEWLVWVAFALVATPAPFGWLGWLSPLAMLYLLLRVTGIPMAEERSLQTKGDAYRNYQARTSPFFPWPPKKNP